MSNDKFVVTSQKVFARAFTLLFFAISATIILTTLVAAVGHVLNGDEATQIIVKIVNASVISMAVFEVALVISKEYGAEAGHDVVVMLRRTLPRFIGTVCVALALEGLMMVIKYSQLDLAGNLYYPVAIIVSSALLLMALGVFLRLAPQRGSDTDSAAHCC
ncbi:MAG: hypothetical protein KGL73_09290 [Burkholderiales bacterium]|nr:hypothetical protein [Burkholderiales bacterium]